MSVPGNFYFSSSVLMKTSKQKLALNSQVKVSGLKKPCSLLDIPTWGSLHTALQIQLLSFPSEERP